MTLLVDEYNPALATLHSKHAVASSIFITACNPNSVALTEAQNLARHASLGGDLQRGGLDFIEGIGQHPHNEWPGERSYLVLGVDPQRATDLALRLEQNAFLYVGKDATPGLALLK